MFALLLFIISFHLHFTLSTTTHRPLANTRWPFTCHQPPISGQGWYQPCLVLLCTAHIYLFVYLYLDQKKKNIIRNLILCSSLPCSFVSTTKSLTQYTDLMANDPGKTGDLDEATGPALQSKGGGAATSSYSSQSPSRSKAGRNSKRHDRPKPGVLIRPVEVRSTDAYLLFHFFWGEAH